MGYHDFLPLLKIMGPEPCMIIVSDGFLSIGPSLGFISFVLIVSVISSTRFRQ